MAVQPPPQPSPPPNWWQSLDTKAKAIISVIGVASAAFGLYVAWDKFKTDSSTCSFSGRVVVLGTQQPAPGASVGYLPPGASGASTNNLVKLAETSSDGTFTGDCGNVEDAAGGGRFEVITWDGPNARLPGLPCLGPNSITYTRIRMRNRGEHSGINVPTRGC